MKMNESEWQLIQIDYKEIQANLEIFEDIKNGSYVGKNPGKWFEYVVNRLFLALGNYNKIVYGMQLDEKNDFQPIKVAAGNKQDCLVSYDDFDLVVEPTLRATYGSADHFSHLDSNPKKKQLKTMNEIVMESKKLFIASTASRTHLKNYLVIKTYKLLRNVKAERAKYQ